MSTLVETKIDTTHRLEKDGRWKTASRFRHKRRQELRESGMSKSDARETAWDEMTWRFPPVDQDWRRKMMLAAKFPSLVPAASAWLFRNSWSAACQLLAFFGSQDENLLETDIPDVISTRLEMEFGGENWAAKGVANEQSLEHLLKFYDPSLLDYLEAELHVVQQALEGDDPVVAATRDELKAVVDAFNLLRDAAKIFWPLPSEL